MLLLQNPCGQSHFRVVLQYRDHSLDNDRPGIDTTVHKVHSTPGEACTIVDGLLLYMQAGKGRQQGRVDVDDPLGPLGDEVGALVVSFRTMTDASNWSMRIPSFDCK